MNETIFVSTTFRKKIFSVILCRPVIDEYTAMCNFRFLRRKSKDVSEVFAACVIRTLNALMTETASTFETSVEFY